MNKNFIKKGFITLFLLGIVLLPCLSFALDNGISPTSGNGISPSSGNGISPSNGNAVGSSSSAATTSVVTKINNPISVNNINDFIKTILVGIIKIGIPIVALAIIYSGFLFVAARGNSEKLKTAKSALMYSLIGAALLLGSWAIAQLISNTVLAL